MCNSRNRLREVFPLQSSACQAPIQNNPRYLSIYFRCEEVRRALLSGISLQRGADLDIVGHKVTKFDDILVGVSLSHRHRVSLSDAGPMQPRMGPRKTCENDGS